MLQHMLEILQEALAVPFRMDDSSVLLLIEVAVIGCLIHFIKEKLSKKKVNQEKITERVKRYDIIQIIVHWLFLIFLATSFFTGIIIFKVDYLYSVYPWLSSSGLRTLFSYHWYFAILLISLSIFHIIYDIFVLGKLKESLLTRLDLNNFFIVTRNFFGLTANYPVFKKYNPLQKVLHWGIALTLLLLGFTGLTIWNPFLELIRSVGLGKYEEWLYILNSRYLHTLFAIIFVDLMIGHFYFSVFLSSNRKKFKGMITGWINSGSFTNYSLYPSEASLRENEAQPR